MNVADWLMVLAVLLAPLVAVQVQKYLEHIRERRLKKLNVFQTLMATRAARLSPAHVQALNMIDMEFYGRKGVAGGAKRTPSEQRVLDAWKVYHDHLCEPVQGDEEFRAWVRAGDNLFIELLYEMARSLGYHFDKVRLRKGIYSPKGYGELELDQKIIRENLVAILSGKKPLPILLASYPAFERALEAWQQAAAQGVVEETAPVPRGSNGGETVRDS